MSGGGPRRAVLLMAAFLTVVVWLPLLSVVTASFIANWGGCVLHEGFPNPCVIAGKDWGGTLYAMGMMGWLMLVTGPFMLISLPAWAIYGLLRWRKRRG